MNEVSVQFPEVASSRLGKLYWTNPANWWRSRRKFLRADNSNLWRTQFVNPEGPIGRSVDIRTLVPQTKRDGWLRFLILGDTGEGDHSQYALLPLIRHADPDFMLINGDVAYPAGDNDDFEIGFFKPYTGLQIPIWAVPGNHEYYSTRHGQEFFEIFCTRTRQKRWSEAGLKLVPQPGTYWELRDVATTNSRLRVIGVDTGKAGDLDGRTQQGGDSAQLNWLQGRLRAAELAGARVILLFHIPFLVDQEHKKSLGLFQLHHLIGLYPCVKLVVTAHQHNHQRYGPDTFRRFLDKVAPQTAHTGSAPHYVMNGDGGAAIGSVDFKKHDYPVIDCFPSIDQWNAYTNLGRKLIDKSGLAKSVFGRVAAVWNEDARFDNDNAGYVSFLVVDVRDQAVEVQPVFLDDVKDLYRAYANSTVHIMDRTAVLDANAVLKAYRSSRIVL